MNKTIITVIIAILTIGGFVLFNKVNPEKSKNFTAPSSVSKSPTIEQAKIVDYEASFAIFTNGTFRIFTDPKYHNQSEDVFIEANNPNIIRVLKSNATWDDFFKTLPMKLEKDCLTTGTGQVFCAGSEGKLRFFLNSREDPNALDQQIQDVDTLLITFGNKDNEMIQKELDSLMEK